MTVTFATREWESEASFQRAVIELANLAGWRTAHFNDSRRQVRPGMFVGDTAARGWPDLVLVRGDEMIVAALKASKGRVSRAQAEWIVALRDVAAAAAGALRVCIWRPEDWPAIEEALA